MNAQSNLTQRQYYLDWLRVLGILLVFVYHSTRFYNVEDWIVKNQIWYQPVEMWNSFSTSFMMPLMFTISGASLFYAIGKGGFGKFLKDKTLRLLVPLLVCILTHASLQSYLYSHTHGLFSGSYFQYLPQYYLTSMDLLGKHLWYLFFLFVYSVLLYPLFRWLKAGGIGVLARVDGSFMKTGVMYALALPLLLLYVLLGADSPLLEGNGGYPYIMYAWFVMLGFLLVSDRQWQDKIRRLRWVSLAVGLVLVAGSVVLLSQMADLETLSASLILAGVMRVCGGWICVLAIFGLAMQYLTVRTARLDYANEAVLPFYILHQTVLLVVGYFVLQWALPDALEWAIIVILSFAIILALYEYLVRRWNGVRFLFGMKPLPKEAEVQVREALPAQ